MNRRRSLLFVRLESSDEEDSEAEVERGASRLSVRPETEAVVPGGGAASRAPFARPPTESQLFVEPPRRDSAVGREGQVGEPSTRTLSIIAAPTPLPSSSSTGGRLPCPRDDLHARQWMEILMHKPPLATFTSRVDHKGYALKRGPTARNLFNWRRTFFTLQHPFLLYFSSNDPKSICDGVVYMQGAVVQHLPQYSGQNYVFRIIPETRRNLRVRRSSSDDEHNFYLSLPSLRELEKWLEVLQHASAVDITRSSVTPPQANNTSMFLEAGAVGDLSFGAATRATPTPYATEGERPRLVSAISTGHPGAPSSFVSAAAAGNMALERPHARHGSYHPETAQNAATSTAVVGLPGGHAPVPSATPAVQGNETRRRSFFAPTDVLRCRNVEFIHHMHCTVCRVSPIFGFVYTCVACDDCSLCANCFHEADHSIRHQFVVSPDVDGECIRLPPCLEGACKTFRTVELVAFEALFRVIAGSVEGSATKPVPKRRLTQFWDSVLQHRTTAMVICGVSVAPLTERFLMDVCRNAGSVVFDEFMFVVRTLLMHGRRDYEAVCVAFEIVAEMVARHSDVARGGAASVDRMPASSLSSTFFSGAHEGGAARDDVDAATRGNHRDTTAAARAAAAGGGGDSREEPLVTLRPLEATALQVYLSACVVDDGAHLPHPHHREEGSGDRSAMVPKASLLSLVHGLVSLIEAGPVSTAVGPAGSDHTATLGDAEAALVCGLHDPSSKPELLRLDEVPRRLERLLSLPRVRASAAFSRASESHGIVEVIEHALLFEVGEGLGMYSPQTESMHPAFCDACGVRPIIGFRYRCSKCPDHDLCAKCYFDPSKRGGAAHAYMKWPGGVLMTAPASSGFFKKAPRGRVPSIAPTSAAPPLSPLPLRSTSPFVGSELRSPAASPIPASASAVASPLSLRPARSRSVHFAVPRDG